jgi:hypothetical protein
VSCRVSRSSVSCECCAGIIINVDPSRQGTLPSLALLCLSIPTRLLPFSVEPHRATIGARLVFQTPTTTLGVTSQPQVRILYNPRAPARPVHMQCNHVYLSKAASRFANGAFCGGSAVLRPSCNENCQAAVASDHKRSALSVNSHTRSGAGIGDNPRSIRTFLGLRKCDARCKQQTMSYLHLCGRSSHSNWR